MAMKELNGIKLTANAKLAYMAMANDYLFYVRERGFYQPWNRHLAEKTGMAESTLRTALTLLENAGLIEVVEAKEGFCKKYKVLPLSAAKKEAPVETPKPVKVKTKTITPTVTPTTVRVTPRAPQPVYTTPAPTTSYQEPSFADLFQDDSDRPF